MDTILPVQSSRRASTDPLSATLARLLISFERAAGGVIVSLIALAIVLGVVLLIPLLLLGIGVLALPLLLRMVGALAHHQRSVVGAGAAHAPPNAPSSVRDCLRQLRGDAERRRELGWLLWQATGGLVLCLLALLLPVLALRDLTFPLWWWAVPAGEAAASVGFLVHDWTSALAVGSMGLAWAAIAVVLVPALDGAQASISRRLLGPDPRTALEERISHLSMTRDDALRAHTTELRRLERELHDGAQSRLLAVVVRISAARRALQRDATSPAALESLDAAHDAAESALTELRAVVRGMLPPALEQHGLAEAVASLAAGCSVPCTVDCEGLEDLPISLEATAYHVVAESLTNVSRHSGASSARVRLRNDGAVLTVSVHDNGQGGATPGEGTGLLGVRRRVAAHDGMLTIDSPTGGPTTLRVELPCTS